MAVSLARPYVLQSPVDLCRFVDELPEDAAGQLLMGNEGAAPGGAVFVENGRVCWAAARGLAGRLSDILAASAQLESAEMESLYEQCRERRAPLGEYLVNAGLITAIDLRAALLKHTAESLSALCGRETRAQWFRQPAGTYNSRFTFRTTELLSRTGADAHATLAASADSELAEAFGDRDWGAAFVRTPGRAAPDLIAVVGAFPETVDVVLRVGRWASSSLDTTSPLHDGHTFVATGTGETSVVAWRFGAAVIAGRMTSSGPARLLNRRARMRREEQLRGSV